MKNECMKTDSLPNLDKLLFVKVIYTVCFIELELKE